MREFDQYEGNTVVSLPRIRAEQRVRGSRTQRSVWFLPDIEASTAAHSTAVALRLRGDLDVAALDCALRVLVARHATDGVTFPPCDEDRDEDPAPPTAKWAGARLLQDDARDLDDAELTELLEHAAHEPFDLARGPLLRIHLYRRARQEMVVLVVAHRVITDAWPMTTLIRELETLYSEQAAGQTGAPPPGPRVTCGDSVRLYRWVSGSRTSVRRFAP